MAAESGFPSALASPTAALVASHKYLDDVAQETSRTLSARNRQVSFPLVPVAVLAPAVRSASVTTLMIPDPRLAESRRARVCAERTCAAFVSVPVAETSHPSGSVSETS